MFSLYWPLFSPRQYLSVTPYFDPNVPITVYGDISKFSYPGVFLPAAAAAAAGLIFTASTQKMLVTVKQRLDYNGDTGLRALSQPVHAVRQRRGLIVYETQRQDLFTVRLWLFRFPSHPSFNSIGCVHLGVRVSVNDAGDCECEALISQLVLLL